ncbi:putative RNA-binding protein [Neolecta irregularis DAH-3]|uniref:Putative RNA-binding protein n=1 Tax=Neolecta irregularis (strain DAH-3) TaxID=1198029 RepID=A0A1U7LK93_NEOID|nr:putative RNA-binding protein [Neolecta irregularis DAH-3]|eukprot:OLL22941.1 putative RNA-binding protein [Neolecta irregularis DAH-3]
MAAPKRKSTAADQTQPLHKKKTRGSSSSSDEQKTASAFLTGFDSSDNDRSNSDNDSSNNNSKSANDHRQFALAPADEATLRTKVAALSASALQSGIVYLGRIPHGFYEDEMKSYFAQFGDSKHYAFIEFESEAVANIVAETMNNYLLSSHILKCKLIPSDQVHPDLFKGSLKKFKPLPWANISRHTHDAPKTADQWVKVSRRASNRLEKKLAALNDAGIDYDFGKTKADKQQMIPLKSKAARKMKKVAAK